MRLKFPFCLYYRHYVINNNSSISLLIMIVNKSLYLSFPKHSTKQYTLNCNLN